MKNLPFDLNRAELLRRVGSSDQLASIRRYVMDDGKGRGARVLEVSTGSGLAFTVYPDKGLDIGPASYNGLSLAWNTPNGLVAPAFYDPSGFEWLRSWAGGLFTTCGTLNVGGPCTTPDGEHGLHGRHDNIPAEQVNTRACWLDDGRYLLEITGIIRHCRVFGEKLATHRTYRTYLGSNRLEIIDRTENLGYETQPFMRLYHMNLGFPLMGDTSFIEAPEHSVLPQNPYCAEHLAEWAKVTPPIHGFPEQVFYHDLPADEEGFTALTLRNPTLGFGLRVSCRKRELPWFVHWRMTGEGEYVTGFEPANCLPEGRPANEKKGTLRFIEPGQTIETVVRAEIV